MRSTGDSVDETLLIAAVLGVGICILFLARRFPKLGVVLWVATACFVPVWFGIAINGPFFMPTTIVGLLLILSSLRLRTPRLTAWDFGVFAFGLIALVGWMLGVETLAEMFVVIAGWMVPFIAGRMVLSRVSPGWVYGTVAIMFSVVALLAIVEWVTQTNIFVGLRANNSEYYSWAPLLARGGFLRAEGAFGHPIALGASIALALPLVVAAPFRIWVRTLIIMLLLGGAVVTFSRAAMLCSVLALVLSVVFLRDEIPRRLRTALIAIGGVMAVAAYSLVLTVFQAAGTEATQSALYRGDLLSLLPKLNMIGLASIYKKSPSGEVYFGNYRSIDSALLLTGLTYGLIALVVVLAILLGATIATVRRRATPATIAIVAQIPAVATVALITQYAPFLFFVGGLAIATQVLRRERLEAQDFVAMARTSPVLPDLVTSSTTGRRLPRTRTATASLRGTNHGTS